MSNPLDQSPNSFSEDAFSSLFETALGEKSIKEKSVVIGVVRNISSDRVLVDVQYKAEGSIPLHEFQNEEGEISIKVGDSIDVWLDSMSEDEGTLRLSKSKADQMKAWDRIVECFEKGENVRGTITQRVKGGLSVDIGVKAFLPGSQVDLRPVRNLEKLLNETMDFRIIKMNQNRGNIVLSRRALLEEERLVKRKETMKSIEPSKIMFGTVKNITDYGAFIDLGGIDGLLHVSDMSWGSRPKDPNEIFVVGDEIEVIILEFDEGDERVSLGYKQLRPNPFEDVDTRYPEGAIVRGKVVHVIDTHAFIELEEGIEGAIHVSEMSWNKRIKNAQHFVQAGDVIEAKIKSINYDDRRLNLSMKDLVSDPWSEVPEKYSVNQVVTGFVRNFADFGIFVGIEENIDGLIHNSDISWSQRIKNPADLFTKGQEIKAVVTEIDVERKRFSLSIKELIEDPWESVSGKYFLGQILKGKVVDNVNIGVFVELESGIEGLVHSSELIHADNFKNTYNVDDEINVEIRNIDLNQRRISLSEKGAQASAEFEGRSIDEIVEKPTGSTLGDMFKFMDNNTSDEDSTK
jgi:small subunit ribosomal protein S1